MVSRRSLLTRCSNLRYPDQLKAGEETAEYLSNREAYYLLNELYCGWCRFMVEYYVVMYDSWLERVKEDGVERCLRNCLRIR